MGYGYIMIISRTLAYLTFLSLPLYLWPSGLPQIGHLLGGAWIFFSLASGKWLVSTPLVLGLIFAFYAGFVNIIVYLAHFDSYSLMSSAYYVYNALLLGAVTGISPKASFNKILFWFFRISLLWLFLETVFSITGIGRTYGGSRAMGTFNDPNQFAHWTLWTVIIVIASTYRLYGNLRWGWTALVLGWICLLFSGSRSGLLGMTLVTFSLFFGQIAFFTSGLRRISLHKFHTVNFLTLAFLILMATFIALGNLLSEAYLKNLQSKILTQGQLFYERILGFSQGEDSLEERGYDRVWKFPEYLLLGAGEGANQRWASKSSFTGEIHSTIAGVLFYYGIPGLSLFLGLMLNLWNKLPSFWLRLLLLAPLFYSLGTYNLRNSMFWLGLGLLWSIAVSLREENTSKSGGKL